jgi:cytochrome P450
MPHISLRGLAKKYGPIIFLQLGEIPTVVISSAGLAKEVLKTHDLVLSSRPQLFSAKHLFYGCTDIAFAPYGAYWRNIRKICILELLSAKRVHWYSFVREEEVARLIRRIAESYPGITNLSSMIALYANDVLCRVALGRDFSGGGEYDRHGFQKMLDDFQALLGGFSLGDYFPSMEFVHSLTGMKSKLQYTFRRFDQFFDEVIAEHRSSKGKQEEKKDLVDVLLDIQKDGSSEIPLTMDNIKAVILVSEEFIGLFILSRLQLQCSKHQITCR